MASNPPIADWHGRHVWLVGASTGIGYATAHKLHAQGAKVFVSARSVAALDAFVAAHAGSVALPFDATDSAAMHAAAQTVLAAGPLALVMYCAGHYKAMRATQYDINEMLRHNSVNYVGALHLIDAVLPAMRTAGAGHISLISSVAGYGGLPNSLAYGPTKAALINLAETLYLDLQASRIGISLICPGFVETPLTAQNTFTMPALLSPAEAAEAIVAGWASGDFEIHFPKRFTRWLKALRMLPYPAYFAAIRKVTAL
jgi:NAD(P)-dependent dehydrogenase (short-subunit alcohol dehydrogenase family)